MTTDSKKYCYFETFVFDLYRILNFSDSDCSPILDLELDTFKTDGYCFLYKTNANLIVCKWDSQSQNKYNSVSSVHKMTCSWKINTNNIMLHFGI